MFIGAGTILDVRRGDERAAGERFEPGITAVAPRMTMQQLHAIRAVAAGDDVVIATDPGDEMILGRAPRAGVAHADDKSTVGRIARHVPIAPQTRRQDSRRAPGRPFVVAGDEERFVLGILAQQTQQLLAVGRANERGLARLQLAQVENDPPIAPRLTAVIGKALREDVRARVLRLAGAANVGEAEQLLAAGDRFDRAKRHHTLEAERTHVAPRRAVVVRRRSVHHAVGPLPGEDEQLRLARRIGELHQHRAIFDRRPTRGSRQQFAPGPPPVVAPFQRSASAAVVEAPRREDRPLVGQQQRRRMALVNFLCSRCDDGLPRHVVREVDGRRIFCLGNDGRRRS